MPDPELQRYARFLAETLGELLAQDFQPALQIVLLDGRGSHAVWSVKSTDDEFEVIERCMPEAGLLPPYHGLIVDATGWKPSVLRGHAIGTVDRLPDEP